MENSSRSFAITGREDISQFIIHLTRDDRATFKEGGATARRNFLAIIKSRKILAARPHCLFNKRLNELTKRSQSKLDVACFTEVPLNQIHLLVGEIPGRQIELEPYGFVFTKDFIAESGGQPAIYINSYNENSWLRESVDELFEASHKNGRFSGKTWRLLPFLNAMHEKYDFSWEREWRVLKDFKFKLSDLICVILPCEREKNLKDKFAKSGIAVISPGWTYEQIVAELARQQRKTKKFAFESDVGMSTRKTEK